MRIRGAVLAEAGAARPYDQTEPLAVVELELDEPGEDEVLVRLEAAGVCHSDLSVLDGARPRPTPMLLGHEGSGRIVSTGQGVNDLSPGQRVVLVFLPSCGSCAGCRSGLGGACASGAQANANGTLLGGATRISRNGAPVLHHLGVSAFATHAVVHRSSVVAVDDDIPALVAALLGCAVLTGGGSVTTAGKLQPGEDVAIVGLGGVGLAAVLTAVAEKARHIVAVDIAEPKRALALRLGATHAFAPEDLVAAGQKFGLVIEAAGSARAFETAVLATAPGGRTVSVGLAHPDQRASISPAALVAEGRTVIGSYMGSSVPARDIPRFAALWREGNFPVELLASSEIALDDINSAMEELAAGRAVRQIVRF